MYSRVELRFEEPDRGNTLVTLKQVRACMLVGLLLLPCCCICRTACTSS